MRELLKTNLIQNIVKQLNISYLNDMLNYVLSATQDETEPKAAQHLIKELIEAFPEEPARQTIMTFAEQLKEDYKQEFMNTLAEQLKQEGRHEGVLSVAKRLLVEEGMPLQAVQRLTGLPKNEVMDLVNMR